MKKLGTERLVHDLQVQQVQLESQKRELREATERLEEATSRYSDLYDLAPVGYCTLDPEGRIRELNLTAAALLGAPRETLIGGPFPSVASSEERRLFDAHLRRCRAEKGRVTSELTVSVGQHGTHTLQIISDPIRDPNGATTAYRTTMVELPGLEELENRLDTAQRVNAALRRLEAKASGIVSIAMDAIISIDPDQRVTLFNKGAEEIFGYSQAEALGAPFDMLIPERLRAVHRQHLQQFTSGEHGSRKMSERHAAIFGLRKNGEEFPIGATISKLELGGEVILTVALRDVTEAKRFERHQTLLADIGPVLVGTLDFEETLTRLAQLLIRDLADVCFIDVVGDDGELRRLRVVGRDPSKQWSYDRLTHIPLDRSRRHLVWSVLDTKQPVLIARVTPEIVASWAQSDEHHRVLQAMETKSVIAVPLLARGKLLGVLVILSSTGAYQEQDLRLMEEVALRAALAIDNAQLYRVAQRAIQTRDNVLGVVAHDLRNPLQTIVMQVQALRQPARQPERRSQKPADRIGRAAERMNRLIGDLLDITRMEASRLSVEQAHVHAGALLSDFVGAQKPLALSKSLELRLDVASDLGEVFADRDRLLQVLENLVGNAVKFTPSGGCVTVGAAPRNGEFLFWVKDTGDGIASDDLPHLFDRFWQRKAGRQGLGLGLPIVRGIVEAHGGRIWVESQIGEGSTFFFALPPANAEPGPKPVFWA